MIFYLLTDKMIVFLKKSLVFENLTAAVQGADLLIVCERRPLLPKQRAPFAEYLYVNRLFN